VEGDFDADADVHGFACLGAGLKTPLLYSIYGVAVFLFAETFDDLNIAWHTLGRDGCLELYDTIDEGVFGRIGEDGFDIVDYFRGLDVAAGGVDDGRGFGVLIFRLGVLVRKTEQRRGQ